MFNFFDFMSDIFNFNSKDDSLIGLKRLQDVKNQPEKPKKEKETKDYKISDLMKKTV